MIETIIIDVDGTLTDGNLYYSAFREELKVFNVRDGLILSKLVNHGVTPIILSGRASESVITRFKELGIQQIYQGVDNKLSFLDELIKQNDYSLETTLYIGDDVNDFQAMKLCKYKGCPADADTAITKIADFKSNFCGGKGAVREIIDFFIPEILIEEYNLKY